MSEDNARRQHRRIEATWKVNVEASDWTQLVELTTSNISRSGLYVCAEDPAQVGSRIRLNLALPDESVLELEGVVIHVITPYEAVASGRCPGFGVQFDERFTIDLAMLEATAAAHAAGKNTYVLTEHHVDLGASIAKDDESPPTKGAVYSFYDKRVRQPVCGKAPQHAAGQLTTMPNLDCEERCPVFGIDIGSTYSRIAMVSSEGVHILEDEQGRTTIPSMVSFHPRGVEIGWEALDAMKRVRRAGQRSVISPKPLLGRPIDDVRVKAYLETLPAEFEASPNGEILLTLGKHRFSMMQLCAKLFTQLMEIGLKATGIPVRRVVISTPVGFTERQRGELQCAAHIAGLNVMALLEEPVAAAMAHGIGRMENETIAMYDFGGGSFNCCVMEIKDKRCQVIAAGGDAWLGGNALDTALAEHIVDMLKYDSNAPDFKADPLLWAKLVHGCEGLKTALSHTQLATLEVAFDHEPDGAKAELEIGRGLLARLAEKLVDQTIDTMQRCFDNEGIELKEIDQILPIGGMTSSPVVRAQLEKRYKREFPLSMLPEQAVVVGNALHGRMIELSHEKRRQKKNDQGEQGDQGE